jgi:hypothetical protein
MRRVRYKAQHRDFVTGEFLGILGIAFEPRPHDGDALSVAWVEFHGDKNDSTIKTAIDDLNNSMAPPSKNNPPVYAIAEVKSVKASGKKHGRDLRVLYWPGTSKAHSQISRVPTDNRLLHEELAAASSDVRDVQGGKALLASITVAY